jgi:pyruvate-formate lyase-activating enzyme
MVLRSIAVIRRSGIHHEFRTTAYPGAVTLGELPRIAEALAGGHQYTIQQFRPAVTLDPRASRVTPHTPDALRDAARLCSAHLPTSIRGV